MMYALVPVRVRIEANSAAEISRAHEFVKGFIEDQLEIEADTYNSPPGVIIDMDGHTSLNGNLFPRQPEDPIEVVEGE